MSKTRIRLNASQASFFYDWLHSTIVALEDTGNLPVNVTYLCAGKVLEKLHAKQLISQPVNMKLTEEQALSIQYMILTNPVPAHWVYIENMLRVIMEQLPPVNMKP